MCLLATFDIRRRVCVHQFDLIATYAHKCSIKNALAHVFMFFLRRRIYISLLSYETHVFITYFPITLTEKNVSI